MFGLGNAAFCLATVLVICYFWISARSSERSKIATLSPLPAEVRSDRFFFPSCSFPVAVLGLSLVGFSSLVGLVSFCTVFSSHSP